jgi:hypothetical protein
MMELTHSPISLYLWQGLVIILITLWMIALVHLLRHKRGPDRLFWLLAITFIPFGGLFYLIWGRRQKSSPSI